MSSRPHLPANFIDNPESLLRHRNRPSQSSARPENQSPDPASSPEPPVPPRYNWRAESAPEQAERTLTASRPVGLTPSNFATPRPGQSTSRKPYIGDVSDRDVVKAYFDKLLH